MKMWVVWSAGTLMSWNRMSNSQWFTQRPQSSQEILPRVQQVCGICNMQMMLHVCFPWWHESTFFSMAGPLQTIQSMNPLAPDLEHRSSLEKSWKEGADYVKVEPSIICHDGESIQVSLYMKDFVFWLSSVTGTGVVRYLARFRLAFGFTCISSIEGSFVMDKRRFFLSFVR